MAKGKGKGSQFERDICRTLSLWWSGGDRDDLFWRSAGSGAMATTRGKRGKSTFGQYGDVQATDPEGQPLIDAFTIEIKRGYSSHSFFSMLDKPEKAARQKWEEFFEQAYQDHTDSGSLTWMLIWKRDRKEPMVFLCPEIMRQIKKGLPCHMRGTIRLHDGMSLDVFVSTLNDFLQCVPPFRIITLLGEPNG